VELFDNGELDAKLPFRRRRYLHFQNLAGVHARDSHHRSNLKAAHLCELRIVFSAITEQQPAVSNKEEAGSKQEKPTYNEGTHR
jgi:hypothetical protein